ncbi:MAG: CRISPR-associated protein Csx28 [Panacibacter sp.]
MNNIVWTDELSAEVSAIANAVLAIAALLAAIYASTFWWHKQKKAEINYELDKTRYQYKLDAYKAAWSLLGYLSQQDTGNNFITYRGKKDAFEYFLILNNAKGYIEKLRVIFYDEGHGIFLSIEVKEKLFHVKHMLHKLLLKLTSDGEGGEAEAKIENIEMVKQLKEYYEDIREVLSEGVSFEIKYKS